MKKLALTLVISALFCVNGLSAAAPLAPAKPVKSAADHKANKAAKKAAHKQNKAAKKAAHKQKKAAKKAAKTNAVTAK